MFHNLQKDPDGPRNLIAFYFGHVQRIRENPSITFFSYPGYERADPKKV